MTSTSDPTSTVDTSTGQDEPLQLIEFKRNASNDATVIKLVESTYATITKKAGNRPLSIICICGPSRQGKSFILGHMIRYLEAVEKDDTDWMDWENTSKPLKGFKFRNGQKPETQGIWVWSRPFIIKDEDDKEFAVILVDTQGTNDEFTTTKDMTAIVGLSLLFSSIMIFNCFTNVQEDILSALNTYTEYGKLALENTKGTPFQKLIFLVRDWNMPGEHPYGSKGGKKFLEDKLTLKPDQPPEARQVREAIRKCFQNLDCFLMPNIGDKALYPEFTGCIQDVDRKFAKNMETFISDLISSENVVAKTTLGEPVTAGELKSYLDHYIDTFNSNELPSAQNMLEASFDVHNNAMVGKACQKFIDIIKKKLRTGGGSYLPQKELDKAQSAAFKQALEHFKKARKFGSPEKIAEYEEQLEKNMNKEKAESKKQNEEKRQKFISNTVEEGVNQYRSILEEGAPFDEDDPSLFYEDAVIERLAKQAKTTVIEEFKQKLEKEEDDIIDTKVMSLESVMETIIIGHVNRNKAQRADAEKVMKKLEEESISKFEDQLKEFAGENKFVDTTDLQDFCKTATASMLATWKKVKKPGKKDFHKEYLARMEKEMGRASSKFETDHKLYLQKCESDAEQHIQSTCKEYEVKLTELAENVQSEEELDNIHEGMSETTIENFAKWDCNPYPVGHPIHDQLLEKLNHHLSSIYEKVKREVVNSQEVMEESYRQAVEESIQYYRNEMHIILASSEFLLDEDLLTEHQRQSKETIEYYADIEKVGFPDNALNFKVELKEKLQKQFTIIQDDNKRNRELAHSSARNVVTACISKYNDVMKKGMDSLRTEEDLEDLHKKATLEAENIFREKCPGKEDPQFMRKFEEMFKGDIEDTWEELKDIFEMKRTQEETQLKGMLVDCRKIYHDEMQKHCKNTSFIRPDHLDKHHQQACSVAIEKCKKKMPITAFQMFGLETEMDSLYVKFKNENDMKLNSAGGVPPAIGIDLGTTYCCVAVFYNGKVIYIPNQEQGNSETTASYVAYHPDGSKTFGDIAKQNAFLNPENTLYDAKRIIGRKMHDPELQRDMKFWPFLVEENEGIPKINVNGQHLFPEQVSAELLSEFRVMAEKHLGREPGTITKAVITVPAYFNDNQRQATVDAGELAGLEVLHILNEPTAAAIAYSLERMDNTARKVLIFDLGGGTFDVAVLDVTPKDIGVLGVDGDTHLGGEDFDQKLMEYCTEMFEAVEGVNLMDGKDSTVKQEKDDARRRLRRLQTECEKAKKNLSSGKMTTVSLDAMYESLDLKVEISRDKFEELNKPQFEKTIQIVEKVLNATGVKKEDIEDIVLVGGSTRIPLVQKMLSDYFGGQALNYSIHPDKAVAYGAAVKAAMMNGEQAKDHFDFDTIEDVIPMSLGIEVVTKELSVIMAKNTKVPKRIMKDYYTVKDNQTTVMIKVFEGEDEAVAANNELLGEFGLENIPPGKAGKERIDVWFEKDSMGILHVEAVCRSTKGSNKITITQKSHRMSADTKRKLLAEANPAA